MQSGSKAIILSGPPPTQTEAAPTTAMSTPQAKGGPVGHESSLPEKSDVDQYPLHGPKLARYTITGRVERRRDWFRPMAPCLSALSSIVANGHQVLPTFPPPPLFIPYGGFSRILCGAPRNA
jgi:hypothetical protein